MQLADLDPSPAALVWYSDDTTTTTSTTTLRSGAVDEEDDNDESSSDSYWSGLETVAAITHHPQQQSTNHERNRTRLFAVPYRVILPLVARLVLRLQQKFTIDTIDHDHDHDHDHHDHGHHHDEQLEKQCHWQVGITNQRPAKFIIVVVAIPEGPYQCLAVAAVHCWKPAVLLPMDPRAEGRERLRHGLDMADLVLVASDHDTERLQQLIMTTTLPEADATAASGESKNTDGTTRPRPPSPPKIWNVKDLLSKEILEYHHEHQHSSPLSLPPSPPEQHGNASSDDVASSPLLPVPPSATDSGSLCERIAQLVPEHQRIHFANDDNNDNDDNDNTVTDGGGIGGTKMSHMVLTSGTSGGRPKACVSSRRALRQYIRHKNVAHDITASSVVLLASNLSFDPCFSDILATWSTGATLQIAQPGCGLFAHLDHVTHILTTPSLWNSSIAVPDAASARAVAPRLQVLALGGEQIPPSLRTVWSTVPGLRLCATYGVTEACVYQTIGDIMTTAETTSPRTLVGTPLGDMAVRICDEHRQDALIDIELSSSQDNPGEIVLRGSQIDALSGYYQAPEMTAAKFVAVADDRTGKMVHHYRTGDRGFVDTAGQLHVLGRIAGEDGTVKFRGVRVDLRDLEYALLNVAGVVSDAMVAAVQDEETIDTTSVRDIVAYVVLHERGRTELHKYVADWPANGLLCRDPALAWLLHTSCASTARTSPTKFILLPRLPLTATGKRDRRALPSVDQAVSMPSVAHAPALASYGRCGRIVAQEITACLNLTTSAQQDLLTVAATFTLLGGDSLTATRVVRAVYARHHQIHDTRHLGGPTGTLDGPFAVHHFLRAENLGHYVDWLDRNGVCAATSDDVTASEHDDTATLAIRPGSLVHPNNPDPGYSALLHATAAGFSALAVALLQQCGVDPNHGQHEGRLGKTNRLERKRNFRSTPLHLACLAGMDDLVTALLDHGANPKCPNASGMFPIHLAASGSLPVGDVVPLEEQRRRLNCCTQLLAHGSPLVMADGSQQTILHAAARSGQTLVLQWALARWPPKLLNLRDQWSRTPVHWAVLNGRSDGLRALLATPGCDPCPRVFGSQHVKSSVALETPLEICRRVHSGGGSMSALGQALEVELVSAMQNWSKQTTIGEQQQQRLNS
jgi:acyl-coenzyme A synthetase/AMP-(fatty) acid ligase/ankyrin repeat protein